MRAGDLPLRYNAAAILESNLSERAGKTALVSGERECSFGEVAAEVNRAGNALRKLGVGRGDVVAILGLDCAEWVSCFFATLKVGGVAMGLNTLLTPDEYVFMLRDAHARVLVVHEQLLPVVLQFRDRMPSVRQVIVIGSATAAERVGGWSFVDWITGESTALEAVDTHRDEIATLNYSSGTTGEPKGIPHAHKDLPLSAELWGRGVLGLREDDRTFAGAKLFFTFGLGGNLIFPWHVGASVVLMSGPPRVATNVLETVARFRPTILYNAPTGYAATLATPELEERYDLSSLRLCVSAGEALPAPLWHEWKQRTGLDIVDGIGCTENFHIFLSNRPDDIRPGSSGKAFDGYELRLVDDEGNEVGADGADGGEEDAIGNLWVRGETASLAYLNRYEDSRRTFRGEWLVTGDKYRRDADGYYWHAGRADDLLKVGGIWVSPVEVESALMAHDAVLECAVVGARDDSGLVKPKAFVTLNEKFQAGSDLEQALIQHCSTVMAAYKRPRWVVFVDELPKTATGKIQRFKLRG